MDKLFELSAELTLDAAAFLRGLVQAEEAMQAAAASIRALQSTADNSWYAVSKTLQSAADTLRHFLLLQKQAASGAPVSSWNAASKAIQSATDKLRSFLALQGQAASAPSAGESSAVSTLRTAAKATGYATGIDYVPYNGFPALLHQGEAVLTALEAQHWRQEPTPSSPSDLRAESLAQAIATALSGLAVQMDGQTVGQLITPTVSREIARQAAATYA